MYGLRGVDAKLEYVNSVIFAAQDLYCPMETFTVKLGHNPHVSAKLAKLSKLKAAEFKKHRYSARFKELKKQCKSELKAIKQRRIEAAVTEGEGSNSWLGRLESLLDHNGKFRS